MTPTPPPPPGWPQRDWRDRLLVTLNRPALLRPLLGALRRVAPMLRIGRRVVVTRRADVLEILHRDQDFTIAEVNSPAINRWSGLFILGMDRGEMYDREVGALRRAAPPEDLSRLRAFAASTAAELVDRVRPVGRIDVVADFARVAPTRLVADYFGVPGP
ncbi:MAG: hypothetical protein H0U41_04540, partial [Actinobacteria bacterium]|nr:hypothetical protein [Actinomycetota bacterium]